MNIVSAKLLTQNIFVLFIKAFTCVYETVSELVMNFKYDIHSKMIY